MVISSAILQLRGEVLRTDKDEVAEVIKRFPNPFAHSSFDAGKIHGTSGLDFLLLRSDPAYHDMDFM
jgi:hypothetical protein